MFYFDEQLILSQYFSKKTNLLHNAKFKNEYIMIDYLLENINTILFFFIFMRKNDDFLNNFNRRVKMNKITTKKIHELFNKTRIQTYDDQKLRKTRFLN